MDKSIIIYGDFFFETLYSVVGNKRSKAILRTSAIGKVKIDKI